MGKKGRQSAARRAVALALTVILTFEALFSNGVSIAIAEEINDTGGVSQQGLTLETTPEQGEGEKTDGTETEPTTEVESKTESATEPEPESETNSTPETETTPEDGGAGEPETEPAPRAVEAWDWTGRTDSLVPGVAFHWANNTIAYVLYNVLPAPDATLIQIFGGSQTRVLMAVGFSLCILVPAIIQLNLRLKKAGGSPTPTWKR